MSKPTTAEVIPFPGCAKPTPAPQVSVEEALRRALAEPHRLTSVVIIGTYADNDLFIGSSSMTCGEALFLTMRAVRHAETNGNAS